MLKSRFSAVTFPFRPWNREHSVRSASAPVRTRRVTRSHCDRHSARWPFVIMRYRGQWSPEIREQCVPIGSISSSAWPSIVYQSLRPNAELYKQISARHSVYWNEYFVQKIFRSDRMILDWIPKLPMPSFTIFLACTLNSSPLWAVSVNRNVPSWNSSNLQFISEYFLRGYLNFHFMERSWMCWHSIF